LRSNRRIKNHYDERGERFYEQFWNDDPAGAIHYTEGEAYSSMEESGMYSDRASVGLLWHYFSWSSLPNEVQAVQENEMV
jgi:hypothetical protein